MAGLSLVLRARIVERSGTAVESIVPSAIHMRPCFFPPPNLMTSSVSISYVHESKSGPWTDLATDVYSLMRVWTLGFVYSWGPSSRLKETSDVAFPLWDMHHAWKSEHSWP